jgi:hypothetical protein
VGTGGTSGPTCNVFGQPCTTGSDCCSGLCDASTLTCASQINQCLSNGQTCSSPTDCCSLSCVGGTCASTQCISDGGACTSDASCCGQKCSNGTCATLNSSCKTSGNSCTDNSQCCSRLCKDGQCSIGASYCVQTGDICARAGDCCTGVCTVPSGSAVGTCGEPVQVPANCTGVQGTVCSGCGDCCSRLCAPYGPTGVKICQPPSGCRIVGELCLEDKDCCGGDPTTDLPGAGNGSCDKSPGDLVGRCRNVQSCSPQGNICHYQDYTCSISSAPNKCCDGVGNSGVCQLDTLGIPRCNGLGTTCRASGEQCASAADCCNALPCVRDSAGVLRCGADACISSGGPCTINADCCPGTSCVIPQGSTSGTCGIPKIPGTGGAPGTGGTNGAGGSSNVGGSQPNGGTGPDGGATGGMPGDSGAGGEPATGGAAATGGAPFVCSEYGQLCNADSDCCNAVPCTTGTCHYPIN